MATKPSVSVVEVAEVVDFVVAAVAADLVAAVEDFVAAVVVDLVVEHAPVADMAVAHARVVDMVVEHGPEWAARHRRADRVELAERGRVAAPSRDRVAVRVRVARDCSLVRETLVLLAEHGPPLGLVLERERALDRVLVLDRVRVSGRERASAPARDLPVDWVAARGPVLALGRLDCLDWVGQPRAQAWPVQRGPALDRSRTANQA